jgi:putative zinc finger/helix-turn-helix YgiT family protein
MASDQKARSPGMECGNCGSRKLKRSVEPQSFTYGVGDDAVSLTARVPVFTCQSCGEAFTKGEAEELRHEAVCRHLGVLTPREIRQLRRRRGWTQVDLARHMRCGAASIKRWELGALIQNPSNDLLLRLLSDERAASLLKDIERTLPESPDSA